MPDDTFGSFIARLDRFSKSLSGPEMKKVMTKVGNNAKKVAAAEASSDLGGDPKFSGWKPELETRFDHLSDGVVSFHPTRSGAGPWTVAEFGRNQGNATGFSGPGVGKTGKTGKTKSGGVKKVKATKSKRWNGTTKGKHTATRALAIIEKDTTKILESAVKSSVSKIFD